ncbi:MAG: FAD-binding oxidoreductase [Acidimicrobiales bacterium]|nr:FAD-binding oxidoreductase [Acidimicrobiales bacterium]
MSAPSIAVVGAGIAGCLTVRELVSRMPGAAITVLERDSIGSGATRRSAGLHLPRGASARVQELSAYSHDYYETLATSLPEGVLFPLEASIVASPSSASALRDTYLSAAALAPGDKAPQPLTSLPAGSDVWTITGAHYSDVYRLTQLLASWLRPSVRWREGVRVSAVEAKADCVVLRLGTGETLQVDFAVLAPGPWVNDAAWAALLASSQVRVKKVVALHIEKRPEPGDQAVIFHDVDAFLLPVRHRGHWLFSYTCDEWDVDPDGLMGGLTGANLDDARECLQHYAPEWADLQLSGRVFCDAYSPDRAPLVCPLDPGGRLVFVGAANGSGYRLGPALAAEAAGLVCRTTNARSGS